MAQGLWGKHQKLNKHILELLRTNTNPSTGTLLKWLFNKKNIKISWHTLHRYLENMTKQGHIKKIVSQHGKFKVQSWTMRGVAK